MDSLSKISLAKLQTPVLQNGSLVPSDWKDSFQRRFSSGHDLTKTQESFNFIASKLASSTCEEKSDYLQLGERLIKQYQNHRHLQKSVQAFDRTLALFRQELAFTYPTNQQGLQKWTRYGMPLEIYKNHPEFCDFLESTGLLSQIKVTKYPPFEINGEVAILVDGKPMIWPELKENFELVFSKRYKEQFLVHKETREVYTFLDNGKGLQPHHPFLTELNPISKVNDTEYDLVLETAHTFVRPGEENLTQEERKLRNKDRTYVLQVVTSFVDGMDTKAHRFLSRAKHPYLRLIVGNDNPQTNTLKGEVYEVGFGWKRRVTIPFVTTQGQFRSPDLWEYVNCPEKIVTNIPITQEEARSLYLYTIKYHRDGVNIGNQPAFHLGEQNCSTYARMAIDAVGIPVPTEISLTDLLREISPDWINQIGSIFKAIKNPIEIGIRKAVQLLPKVLQHPIDFLSEKVSIVFFALIQSIAALSLVPIRTALGGGMGTGGNAFVPRGCPKRRIEPLLFNWKNWFRLSSYRINLPGVLQQWQRQQPSTVIYKNPVRFAIVPESV